MRRLLVLALLGCASGGSSAPAPADAPAPPDRILLVDQQGRVYRTTNTVTPGVDQVVPGTTDEAVQALLGAYGELGLSVNTIEPRAGRVGARDFSAPSRLGGRLISTYVDCGPDNFGNPRASTYALLLNVQSAVQPASAGHVRATTTMTATGRKRGVSGDPITCESTGVLEKQLNVLMAARLAK